MNNLQNEMNDGRSIIREIDMVCGDVNRRMVEANNTHEAIKSTLFGV